MTKIFDCFPQNLIHDPNRILAHQVCCKDLWYLEVEPPAQATRVQLVRASTTSLELCWASTPTASHYILEVQKIPTPPPTPTPQPVPQGVEDLTPAPVTAPVRKPIPQITSPISSTPGNILMSPTSNVAQQQPQQVLVQNQTVSSFIAGALALTVLFS